MQLHILPSVYYAASDRDKAFIAAAAIKRAEHDKEEAKRIEKEKRNAKKGR